MAGENNLAHSVEVKKAVSGADLLEAQRRALPPAGLHAEVRGQEPILTLSKELTEFANSVLETFSDLVKKLDDISSIHDTLSSRSGTTLDHVADSKKAEGLWGDYSLLKAKLIFRFPENMDASVRNSWKETDGGKKLIKLGKSKEGSFNIAPVVKKNGESEVLERLEVEPVKVKFSWGRGKVLRKSVIDVTPPPAEAPGAGKTGAELP